MFICSVVSTFFSNSKWVDKLAALFLTLNTLKDNYPLDQITPFPPIAGIAGVYGSCANSQESV